MHLAAVFSDGAREERVFAAPSYFALFIPPGLYSLFPFPFFSFGRQAGKLSGNPDERAADEPVAGEAKRDPQAERETVPHRSSCPTILTPRDPRV